jgi:hypothetical protein
MLDPTMLEMLSTMEHEDRQRAAEARRFAEQAPSRGLQLRATLSRWLQALADRLEPPVVEVPIEAEFAGPDAAVS